MKTLRRVSLKLKSIVFSIKLHLACKLFILKDNVSINDWQYNRLAVNKTLKLIN